MKTTRLSWFVLISLFLLLTSSAFPASAQVDIPTIDDYIEEAMQTIPIPGLALVVVKDGQVAYMKGYGEAGPDGSPVTPQTPFHLGSAGKTFTALAIMQLANQGKVELSAPVKQYLPEFTVANGEEVACKITLIKLLNHQSGFSRMDGGQSVAYDPGKSLDDMVEWISTIEQKNPVGKVEYSNLNFILLGAVVQRVSEMDYREYVHENILQPLGMDNTYFSDVEAEQNGAAQGYQMMFGFPAAVDFVFPTGQIPAGFVYSSAEDMAKYLMMYLNDGFLGEEQFIQPLGSGMKTGYFTEYWQWISGKAYGERRGHEGGTVNFNSQILYEPDRQTGVVILTNSHPSSDFPNAPSVNPIANGVLNIALGQHPVPLSDGGFRDDVLHRNLVSGVFLAIALADLITSLVVWPKLFKKSSRFLKVLFFFLLGLDILVFLVFLIGVPILTGLGWITVLKYFISERVLLFGTLGILVLFSAVAKLVLRFQFEKTKAGIRISVKSPAG
ncbi:MAG: class A beta-lactamase-related serine hydrolase [Chloroflexi bacterium]|nr:MAG: class A beta-lactamase-related serine hydrolase [Chloroflexota bacterium]